MESQEKEFGVFIYDVYLTEDEIKEIEEKSFDYWRKEANIPGYRKGMAPKSLIYQKYSENIEKTFREILTEKIKQEIVKKHKFDIDSIRIVDQRINENKNLIEIPGQVSKNEFVFVVKVSTKTMVIIEDEEKIRSLPKSINFLSYSLKKDTVDLDDFKKFMFSSKRFDDVVVEDFYKCIVEVYVKVSDSLPSVNLYFYLGNFKSFASKIKGKKVFESFEISLDREVKEVLKNYLNDLGLGDLDVPATSEIMLSKIIYINDSEEILKENMEIFSRNFGDPNVVLLVVLDNAVYRYNVSRLMSRMIAKVISSTKIYVGENEYISSLLGVVQNLLVDYSYTPLHISSYPINFNYYSNTVFRSIVERKVVETLYNIFVGKLNGKESYDDISLKVYDKVKDFCSIEVKEITYSNLKETLPYLFFEIVSK